MTARLPMVFGADGMPQQLQTGDAIAGAAAITGGTVNGLSSLSATSGDVLFGATSTSAGSFLYKSNAGFSYFGIYDGGSSQYYGISISFPAPSGVVALGGYYKGLGIGGSTNGAGNPIFGVLNSGQSGNGLNYTTLTAYDNKKVVTFNNTLDDGSGNAIVAGTQTVKGVATHNASIQLASYTVSTLPSGVNGYMAYASNGRKTGEASGSGTGVLVVYSNSSWRRLSDDTAVVS